uniref:Inotocin receptor 1 n=1 Tax=Ixodes scapularis TaxID=6945 RepID=A0A1L1ULU4_IXOSC|nr:inotocin receptor 1 [Ixodes scapularis]
MEHPVQEDTSTISGSDLLNTTVPETKSSRDESLAQVEVAVLTFIFGFTVLGNTCVLVALAARRSKMTRMYYFLIHLCVSDLTTAFLSVLPQLGWDATHRFRGGNLVCKAVKFGQLLGPYLSSYVLVVTAVDRYQAICFPLSNCSWSPTKCKLLIAGAWVAALVCCVPQVFIFSYQEVAPGVFDCWGTFAQPWGLRAYVTWYSVSVFFVPLAVLSFTYVCICRSIWRNLYLKRKSSDAESWSGSRTYRFKGSSMDSHKTSSSFVGPRSHSVRGMSRAKVKTVKITVVVIALYIVCSSPFICVQMWMYWSPDVDLADVWINATVTILMLLNSLNSCVNPWVYLFFNRSLVHTLRHQICRCPDAKNVSSGIAGTGSCPSAVILADLTTQGTEAQSVLSYKSSPTDTSARLATAVVGKRGATGVEEDLQCSLEKTSGASDARAIKGTVDTIAIAWRGGQVLARKTSSSYQDILAC